MGHVMVPNMTELLYPPPIFKSLEKINTSIFMKLGQNILTAPHSIWAQVLPIEYGRNDVILHKPMVSQGDSLLWKSIIECWPSLQDNFAWNLGNGLSTTF